MQEDEGANFTHAYLANDHNAIHFPNLNLTFFIFPLCDAILINSIRFINCQITRNMMFILFFMSIQQIQVFS